MKRLFLAIALMCAASIACTIATPAQGQTQEELRARAFVEGYGQTFDAMNVPFTEERQAQALRVAYRYCQNLREGGFSAYSALRDSVEETSQVLGPVYETFMQMLYINAVTHICPEYEYLLPSEKPVQNLGS